MNNTVIKMNKDEEVGNFVLQQPTNVATKEVIVVKKKRRSSSSSSNAKKNTNQSKKAEDNTNSVNITIPEIVEVVRHNLITHGSPSIKKGFIANVANLLGQFYGKKVYPQQRKELESYVEKIFKL